MLFYFRQLTDNQGQGRGRYNPGAHNGIHGNPMMFHGVDVTDPTQTNFTAEATNNGQNNHGGQAGNAFRGRRHQRGGRD